MPLPLPNNIDQPPALTADGHAGLWFERFFDRYGTEKREPNKECNPWGVGKTDKHDWLGIFPASKRGNPPALQQQAQRNIDLILAQRGDFAIFQLDWHFVTGMGYPHPVENGLAWHPTLGVPYLSGAAVKGLLRSWMDVWQGADEATLRLWFGSESKEPDRLAEQPPVAGELVFFDALPVDQVELVVDIMTPHMGKWYEQGGKFDEKKAGGERQALKNTPDAIPADWHDPVPVPYLTVKQAVFLVGIAPRHPAVDAGLVKNALATLDDALQFMGAGAKTAVGYGVMSEKSGHPLRLKADEQQEAQRKSFELEEWLKTIKHLSAMGQSFARDARAGNWERDKDAFTRDGIKPWLAELKAMEQPDKDVLQRFEQLMRSHYKGLLDNPDATNAKGNYVHKKENQRQFAKALLALLKKPEG